MVPPPHHSVRFINQPTAPSSYSVKNSPASLSHSQIIPNQGDHERRKSSQNVDFGPTRFSAVIGRSGSDQSQWTNHALNRVGRLFSYSSSSHGLLVPNSPDTLRTPRPAQQPSSLLPTNLLVGSIVGTASCE